MTKIVTLRYHREAKVWWVDSDDMPGFSAAADSLAEVRKEAQNGARFYFANGLPLAPGNYTLRASIDGDDGNASEINFCVPEAASTPVMG